MFIQEHCLMGIKGTVRRNTDAHIIHANVDTDIIVAEEAPFGSTRKPEEIYSVIEHFCLVRDYALEDLFFVVGAHLGPGTRGTARDGLCCLI